MARPENHDGPRGIGRRVRLKIELHRAAARHAHVGAQAPVHEPRPGGVLMIARQNFLRPGNRLGLDTAPPDGSQVSPRVRDEHFCAAVLGRAAERIDKHDEDEGGALVLEFYELIVEAGRPGCDKVGRHPNSTLWSRSRKTLRKITFFSTHAYFASSAARLLPFNEPPHDTRGALFLNDYF
jgi:hypothetical protein